MQRTFFERKAPTLKELKGIVERKESRDKYVIEKTIELPPELWEFFINRLLRDFDFIAENKKLQYIDTDSVWHCLAIKPEGGGETVLCQSEGYDYCRYSAYLPEASEK